MTIDQWSTTPANNASGVTGVNWAEGQAPSTVNDSARQVMADVAAWYAAVDPAGRIEQYGGASAPTGWLECDGSAVNRTTYARLFTAISTTWGVGDASTTFNLPDFRSRVLVGKGTGTATASGVNGDVDTAADTLTVASNNTKWITGMAVVFTLSSGTITGLTSGNTYYIIRSSATLVQLASSLVNAVSGTAVDMTAKSSPVWTITTTWTARTLAEQGGEETHGLTKGETPLKDHLHAENLMTAGSGLGGSNQFNSTPAAISGLNTGSTGDATITSHNVIQPFAVTMFIIRT